MHVFGALRESKWGVREELSHCVVIRGLVLELQDGLRPIVVADSSTTVLARHPVVGELRVDRGANVPAK